eukprot:1494721-Rhodomonas_salina.1
MKGPLADGLLWVPGFPGSVLPHPPQDCSDLCERDPPSLHSIGFAGCATSTDVVTLPSQAAALPAVDFGGLWVDINQTKSDLFLSGIVRDYC